MSHLDDVDFLFWGPLGGIGAVLALVALVWALSADAAAERACTDRGERYVDSREGYTLCEADGGAVVRR